MRVVFSDESGTGREDQEPYCVVAAVMFNMDTQWEPAARQLRELLPRGRSRRQGAFEFKGRTLFRQLKRRTVAAGAHNKLRGICRIITENHVPVFYGACDRREVDVLRRAGRLRGAVDDYFLAFHRCLEDVEKYIHPIVPKEKVLWIADQAGSYQDSIAAQHGGHKKASQMARAMFPFTKQAMFGKDALKALKYFLRADDLSSPLSEAVFFGDSRVSPALQIADVACAILTNFVRGTAAGLRYLRLIEPQIVSPLMLPPLCTPEEREAEWLALVRRIRPGPRGITGNSL